MEMESAKSAGYVGLLGGIAFIPFAFAFRGMAMETNLPVLATLCMIIFWVLIVFIAICLFYGVWGLACGYSQSAWNRYAGSVNDAQRKGAEKECAERGVEPSAWLKY